jgi:YfiH family protein
LRVVQNNGLRLWEFDNLANQSLIKHFVTGRNTVGDQFTLSYSSTPDKEAVRQNRKAIADAFGIREDRLVLPSQIHKTNILRVTPETDKSELVDTDALITSARGICIAVMSADCVPILLFDKKNHVVGAVHSGWRGTVARILEKTLDRMKGEFGTQGVDIIAGIGPSVSQDQYEVGEEVVTEVQRAFGSNSNLMIHLPDNKARLDLWKANTIQLLEFGVPTSAIEVSDLCTVRDNQDFFSARKGDSGRFAAGIMLT